MNAMPQITIGMPVFNDALFIEKSIKSILSQTFTDFILIISDDGSMDGSQQICEKYVELDNRVKYIRQPQNLGISRNMQYLLSLAETPYFMWAGDDDLMVDTFVEKLYNALENNKEAVSAFSTCALIDEDDNTVKEIDIDYGEPDRNKRLRRFIRNDTDYFGYGMFRTDVISGVEFPVWWWPNKKTPYNNIYPTLTYYLAKGDYVHVQDKPLFLKRVKTSKNTHHLLVGRGNGIGESFAYWIRKFNLVVFTTKQIRHSAGWWCSCRHFPLLFWKWFVVPSWEQFVLAFKAMIMKIKGC
ncbi:MAG: glycosyltransferase family 2 protein [Bacteroidales bacterium]|nr:glycosyltransferase family 2 protein [Bacteroidales bacterium]